MWSCSILPQTLSISQQGRNRTFRQSCEKAVAKPAAKGEDQSGDDGTHALRPDVQARALCHGSSTFQRYAVQCH